MTDHYWEGTNALPGSEEKIRVMRQRYKYRWRHKLTSVFHPDDKTIALDHSTVEKATKLLRSNRETDKRS